MAKGKKTGGRDFKPGHKLGGRKKLPEDIRIARNMSYEEMCRSVIEIRNMTILELKKIDMEKITLGKRAIINAYAELNYKGIKEYEDRLWGKASENIDLNINEINKESIEKIKKTFNEQISG